MTYAVDATGPFYPGTRADLNAGDLLAPGFESNYGCRCTCPAPRRLAGT